MDFRSHLVSYLAICGFLLAINLMTSPGYLWVMWPALGWGLAVVLHGLNAYGIIADKEQEEEMIEEEVRRLERDGSKDFPEADDRLDLREIDKEVRHHDDDFV